MNELYTADAAIEKLFYFATHNIIDEWVAEEFSMIINTISSLSKNFGFIVKGYKFNDDNDEIIVLFDGGRKAGIICINGNDQAEFIL